MATEFSTLASRIFQVTCIALVASGTGFRFANLDSKVYGNDESITIVRVAGFTTSAFRELIFTGQEIAVSEIQKSLEPSSATSVKDTVGSLAAQVPQHSPLYFILARLWAEQFGTSIAATKTLPVLISLLIFPSIYWLCRELFNSPLVAWSGMAMIAISPFHILYAQESRPYSLFSVATLLSSALLLRAVSTSSKRSWATYALGTVLGLYSQLLFLITLVGHGLYVIISDRGRIGRATIGYLVAASAAVISFFPWVVIIATGLPQIERTMGWTATGLPLSSMVKSWVGDLSRLFVDTGKMGPDIQRDTVLFVAVTALAIGVLTLVGYSLWFLFRNTPRRTSSFIFVSIAVSSLPMIAVDLILGRHMSTIGRYLIPCFLGIQIAVAYCLAAKVNSVKLERWNLWLWRTIAVIVVVCGMGSSLLMSKAAVWWNWGPPFSYYPALARIINQSENPLVVSDCRTMEIVSLSYLLHREAHLFLVRDRTPETSLADRDVFVFRPTHELKAELEKSYRMDLLHKNGELWRLTEMSRPVPQK